MMDLWITFVTLIPMDVVPPSPGARPSAGGNGFAAAIVGGFFGLGILILAAILLSLKPKRVKPFERNTRPPTDS
ncbi:MAG TPA: hypothetical protein VIT20_07410 [Propionibacteriaceae bacterium]